MEKMERDLELYVLCDPRKPPMRLNRLPSCPLDAPCFSAPLPTSLPSQLLVFGMGDWTGLSADGEIEVILEGGAKEHKLGKLTMESRCFIWQRDPNDGTFGVSETGELHIRMVIHGQTRVKQERGKRKRAQDEQENVCPNNGGLRELVPPQKSKGGTFKLSNPVKGTGVTAGPTPRWGHTLCPVDSKTVILIGGQGTRMHFCKDSMWKLNTADSMWSPAEALTDGPSPESRTGHTAVFDPESQRIYVFGGSKNKKWFNDVHILDTDSWKWSSVEARGKVPPLSYHSCSLFRGEMFVFGGVFPRPNPEPDGCSDSLYIFDPQHEIWYEPIVFGKKPPARSGHSACLMRRELYIFGGWDTPVCYNDLYLLDLGLMEFSPVEVKGGCPSPRCWHTASPISDTHFLIHGGYDGNQALNDTHIFNTVTKAWTSLIHKSLPCLPRAGHSMLPLPRVKKERSEKGITQDLLIFGGGDNEGQFYRDTVRLYLTDHFIQ